MPSKPSRRKIGILDILDKDPYEYFSHMLDISDEDTINAIVDDYKYLQITMGFSTVWACIIILRQFGYIINPETKKEVDNYIKEQAKYSGPLEENPLTYTVMLKTMIKEKESHILSSNLFVELSREKTYSIRKQEIGRYVDKLEGDDMPCKYPLPCSNHILKFNHKGKPIYFPPIVDRPENNNNNIPDQAYVQVYTVNGKDYVHHSTGLSLIHI